MDEVIFNTASEIASITGKVTECEHGAAGMFPCAEVDMISFLTRQEIGPGAGFMSMMYGAGKTLKPDMSMHWSGVQMDLIH